MTDALQTETEEGQAAGTISENVTLDESGLAPDTGENQSKNNDGVSDQDKVNKAINKQHAKYREEQRKRIQIEKERDEARQRLAEFEEKSNSVDIPKSPDPFDPEFESKRQAREDAIARKAEQDAAKAAAEVQQSANVEAAQQAEFEKFQARAKAYDARIGALKLDAEEIQEAAKVVGEYGIHSDLIDVILDDEDGPLITKYLAANPLELDDLNNMSTVQAAIRINSIIKPAAALLKPQASTETPDPVGDIDSGRGGGEKTSELLKGATFE